MALAGLAYFILVLASLILWSMGFNPYCGYGLLLGRSLLLWGAVAYACMAVACFSGMKKRYVLAGATFLTAVHASFLTLAWRASGYLCPACAVFFCMEVALVALLAFAPAERWHPVLFSLAGGFLLAGAILLGHNPFASGDVSLDAGVPENIPVIADSKVIAAEEVAASDGRAAGEPPVPERNSGAVGAGTEATPAPAAAGIPVPDKPVSGGQGQEALLAVKASSGGEGKEAPLAVRKPLVAVMTADGQQAELDISRRPVLYFAWWCPACRVVLAEVARLPAEKRPYLVAVCFTPVDVSRSAGEVEEVGLPGIKFYISRESPGGGLPALLFLEGGRAKTVNGKAAVLREIGKGEP